MKKSSFKTLLGFTPNWGSKPTTAIHADNLGVYTSDELFNLSKISKIHLKCDVFDGSVVSGLKQLILYSFLLDKPSDFNVFCEPETIHYEKVTLSVLKTNSFC